MALKSSYWSLPIPDSMTCSEFSLSNISSDPDRTAWIDLGSGKHYTFCDVKSNVAAVRSSLLKLGLKKGDVMLLFAPNSAEYATMILALLSIGVIKTGVNPIFTDAEVLRQMEDSCATSVMTTTQLLPIIRRCQEKYKKIKTVIVVGGLNNDSFIPFESLLRGVDSAAFPKIDARATTAILPYSSGTTGMPKGVMLSHYNMIANIIQISHPKNYIFKFGIDTTVAFQPMYHVAGIIVIMLNALYNLATVVIMPKFEYHKFLQACALYKATTLSLMPPIALRMSKDPDLTKYDLSNIKTICIGSAPVPRKVLSDLAQLLNIPFSNIMEGYGMTEGTCVSHNNPRLGSKVGSVGKVVCNTQCKIIDIQNGATLGPNLEGEVCIKGPQVMMGYLNRPKQTAETIDANGWLHTGDVGYHDDDGYLFLCDRIKELIKYKALQIAPAELEATILLHPDVEDVGVVGVKDERAGEVPRAYVVLKPNRKTSKQSIRDHVEKNLATYKQLRGGVLFVKSIPKSPSGKILRRHLKSQPTNKSKL